MIIYALVLAGIIIITVCLARCGKFNGKAAELEEVTMSSGERVIRVYDMDINQLTTALRDFAQMYGEDWAQNATVTKKDDCFSLTLIPTINYYHFCLWVNYLVYSDKNQLFKVRGWYPFGEVKLNNEVQPFSNQTVMIYVDKDDDEYDNVSFVTPDGNYYFQPFASNYSFKAVKKGSEDYVPLPEKDE